MSRLQTSSLRLRVLLLISAAVLPWLGVTVEHAFSERKRDVEASQRHMLYLAQILSSGQREVVAGAQGFLQVLAAMPEVAEGAPAHCRARLESAYMNSRGYVNIVVADGNGTLLCDALNSAPANFADRKWFRDVLRLRHFAVGDYVIGRLSGRPVLTAALPILDASAHPSRVVFLAIDVGWLERLLAEAKLPVGMMFSIMDAQGVVLARFPQEAGRVGKPHPIPGLVQAIRAGGAGGIGEGIGAGGKERLFAYDRALGGAGGGAVYVSASLAKSQVLEQGNLALMRQLAVLGLLTLAIFVFAWFATGRVVQRRIRLLIEAAHKFERGDMTIRASVGRGAGELIELERAFNDMASSVERTFNQNEKVMQVASESIIVTDSRGVIVKVNAFTEKLFGYQRDELLGQSIQVLVPLPLREAHLRHMARYQAQPEVCSMGARQDLSARCKDGTEIPVNISLGPLVTEEGRFTIAAVRDIRESKAYEARILHQATHDALTGLPNRALFLDLLNRAMIQAEREECLLAVVFLDLDGFKNINDTLGHDWGDQLLREIAQRISAAVRRNDVVARQGGDEFTILLQGVKHVDDVLAVLRKILAAVSEPVYLREKEIHVTASLGITIFPLDDTDAEHLLRNADTAMYRAKEAGRDSFQFYTAEMNAQAQERLAIETDLRRAIAQHEFVLHFQPQVDIASGRVIGAEALLRWNHPEKGMIPPGKFIPVAEESGLIVPIGEWVLRDACRQLRAWQLSGLPSLRIAVNLSARQFREPNLPQRIAGIMAECGLENREVLEVEITESLLMKNVEVARDMLKQLFDMGVRISVDDFGTGYSSLSYLQRFCLHALKVDQSFVRDITTGADGAVIAGVIVDMAHKLKLSVIAEGVETLAQLEYLEQIGCDEIQGFYFSRPLPAAAFEALVRQGRALRQVA
ncbi:MAG: EAL domain-containing protein [Hydrogenophilales bacterium]|nr:EAL domain-containing protein [Hydrogenophilales bacterium]